jgi:hypothetical protein
MFFPPLLVPTHWLTLISAKILSCTKHGIMITIGVLAYTHPYHPSYHSVHSHNHLSISMLFHLYLSVTPRMTPHFSISLWHHEWHLISLSLYDTPSHYLSSTSHFSIMTPHGPISLYNTSAWFPTMSLYDTPSHNDTLSLYLTITPYLYLCHLISYPHSISLQYLPTLAQLSSSQWHPVYLPVYLYDTPSIYLSMTFIFYISMTPQI